MSDPQRCLGDVARINPESLGVGTPSDFAFKYVDISCVSPGLINWSIVREYQFNKAPSRARRVVKEDDVLICTVRPGLQAHGYVNKGHNEAMVASTGFAVVRCDRELRSRYLFHSLFGPSVPQQLRERETGTNYPAVNERDIKELLIYCPDGSIQEEIAHILDVADEAIVKTEELIDKLKAIKQGLLHHLLTRGLDDNGEIRDPEKHPEQFQKTPLGRFPTNWDMPTIDDLAVHVGSGITPTGGSHVYKREGILFIRSQNVTFEGLLLQDVAYIDERTHRMMTRSEVFPHDVLLNITGASIGRCCPLPEGLGTANVNQHVCSIRIGEPRRKDAVFLSAVLASFIGQNQIDRLNAGSNRQGLNYRQLRSISVPWPKNKSERAALADKIERAEARIQAERTYLSKLKFIKKGLMQDLLTGRVRVNAEAWAEGK